MLEIRHLSFDYRGQPALRDVSFSLPKGEALGLLGHNGAGKTTLLSLLCGLLPPQRGEMLFDGRPLAALMRRRPAPLAVVPQDFAFYPMLGCRENLRFFAEVQGISGARRRERVEAALSFAQLEAYAGTRAEALSGGLKRRLNLAIGLLGDPEILLLDEPTTGVDPHSRQALIDSIAGLKREGKTLIYTSHYLDEVERLADRLVILDRGSVRLQGDWQDIRRSQSRHWELTLDAPLPDAALQRLRALAEVDAEAAPRYRITAPSSEAARELWRWLAELEIPVRALYTGEASLERLYLQLTRDTEVRP